VKGTVLDYSYWRPTDAQYQQLKDQGVEGFMRYLSYPDADGKVLHGPEREKIFSFGFSLTLNFEYHNTSWLGGGSTGFAHGQYARKIAREEHGWPDERPIVFSVDTDVRPDQYPIALDYLKAAADGGGVGPQSAYGESGVIDAAVRQGICRFSWWAMAASAWDPSISATASLAQTKQQSYAGMGAYDENIVIRPDWGQYRRGAPVATIDEVNLRVYQLQNELVGAAGSAQTQKNQVAEALAVAKQALAIAQANQTALSQLLSLVQGLSIPPPPPVDANAIAVAVGNEWTRRWTNG
jgi:hypothetical protein